ncbi:hypothetical protein [Tuberibacillus sp. Marseille-P3662]|uniref:hypothetical protein n=1 Tax=Tuberibacillus sp. Marseille-P3662 TaxID=1965358 RepID=UPI000A1CF1F3|nr:hypothetical protein [Tuberibacillus sp. Marseille-P3662]
MKKYWKVITITVIAVLSISTFYIQSAMSATDRPEFTLTKQKGDASLVKSMVIKAYQQEPVYKRLNITTKGSKSYSDMSYLDQLNGHHQPMIKELIKNHRGFMRGKDEIINDFYEDKQFLAYAGVNYQTTDLSPRNFKFSIAILDKEENETTSYKLSVPNGSDFNYMTVEDVQVMNKKLKLITKNSSRNGIEMHMYTFDIATNKLVADETIISSFKEKNGQHTDIHLIGESNPKQGHKTVIFNKTIMKDMNQKNHRQSVASEKVPEQRTLIAYNLMTKKKETIEGPRKLQEDASIQAFDGSHLYFKENNKHETIITPYDLETEQTEDVIKVSYPKVKDHAGQTVTVIRNGKLYTLSPFVQEKSAATLTVTDIQSGNTLYKGRVKEKQPDKDQSQYQLSFYSMTVK